ncbi:MAG: L-histidine N(alpha)-methyltransferase [Proteobacteria bacterium]|nr:L-histidine N(alpha)-methyltransferase [Pseudomonadota bacterium]
MGKNIVLKNRRNPERSDFADAFKRTLKMEPDAHLAPFLYDKSAKHKIGNDKTWKGIVSNLSEYYVPQAEKEILHSSDVLGEINKIVGAGATLIELGPGSTALEKTAPLIRKLEGVQGYIGIDVSSNFAKEATYAVRKEFTDLYASSITGNFYDGRLKHHFTKIEKPVLFSVGTTIGNIAEDQNVHIPKNTIKALEKLRTIAGDKGFLIVSQDTNRDEASLKQAYFNDSFKHIILSILDRAESEPGISLERDRFYNRDIITRKNGKQCSLISQLVANADQEITFPDESVFYVKAGNTVDVIRSNKFEAGYFQQMAMLAGWKPISVFKDKNKRMALHVLQAIKQNQD